MAESIGKGEQQDLSARAAVGLLRKIVRFRTDLESVRLDTIDKVDQSRENSPGKQRGPGCERAQPGPCSADSEENATGP
jgi:hypothetical protein